MDRENNTQAGLSLYFMEDNPIEAVLLKDHGSDSVRMNYSFRKMFSLPDLKLMDDVFAEIIEKNDDLFLLKERILNPDNNLFDKPVKITRDGRLYNFYIYYNRDYNTVIIHARDMAEFEKLAAQLDDYAGGLVQNIFDLEISQRKLIQSGERLSKQLKATTELGLTTYESFKNTRAVFRVFTELSASTLDVERCGIWLLEENGERLRCADLFTAAEPAHTSGLSFLSRSNPEIFKAVKTDRILKADDAVNNPSTNGLNRSYLEPNGITSILLASIVLNGKVAGIVSFEHTGNIRKWEEDECGFAVIFADHVTRILSDVEKNTLESQLIQSQKMETIGTLVGGLAHDFNNLLGGIVGSLSLLKIGYKDMEEGELLKYFNIMENASGRATDLVKQLLAVASKQDLVMVPVDLNLAINHIVKISKNTFDKSVEIKYHYYETPAVAFADPIQIEQVLLNLCINACHAITIMRDDDPHGGTITVNIRKLHADELFLQSHPEAIETDYWVISIEDTGVGMSRKTLDHIFEPFFTTKKNTRIKGSGLGLTMVYNIIHDHSGFIEVYSEISKGSVFSVYLPVLEQEYIEKNKAAGNEIIYGEGTILVIDDEELIRVTTRKMLQASGYRVILAENGDEGIRIFREKHDEIKAIILDMAMPKKSGRDSFFEMKKFDPGVRVLLATGYKHDERSEEIIKSGVKGFIQKPYTIAELSRAISDVIKS